MRRFRVLAVSVVVLLFTAVLAPSTAYAADPVGTVKARTQKMSGPALPPQYSQAGWYEVNAKLNLVCFQRGQAVKGYYSSSFPGGWDNLWYKVSDGYWVADVDIDTKSNNPVTGECANGPVAAAIDTNAWYSITPKNSGLRLDIRGAAKTNGTLVQQYGSNSSAAQRFRFIANGDGTYRISSALTSAQVLDVAGGGTGSGAKVQTWTWANVGQQRWHVSVSAASGYVTIKPAHATSRCLDVPGGSTKSGVQLQIHTCNNTSSQQFKLTGVGVVSPPIAYKSEIKTNVTLRVNDSIKSNNGKYSLVQQGDGNLVLYGLSGALWANKNMIAGSTTTMQGDGNLVSYQGGKARWASNTAGKAGVRLVVQDDGNVVIYTSAGKAVWSTNTVQGPPPTATPAFRLPFASGVSVKAGAPHANDGRESGVRNSVDFGPGGSDKAVRAIASGTVYKVTCGSNYYLGIDHGGGWKSTYYHLTNVQSGLIGKSVSAGTYLGQAGRAVPCGGSATFDHVHLSLFKNNAPVSLNGVRFGSYVVYSGSAGYHGYWNTVAGARALTINGLALCCITAG